MTSSALQRIQTLERRPKRLRAVLAGIIGTVLEYYDAMLYMHFLPILSPLFFPHEDPSISSLLGMASFAVGFLMRPLGGMIFGHIGDRWGRKIALGLSIILISFPTFIIGLLPTYAQIGIFASIVLVVCRLMQNFCVGGEAIGGSVFLIEHAKPGYESRTTCLLNVGVQVGSLIGAGLGLICLRSFLPEWGWRVPFLLSVFFALFGYYVRKKVDETPEFIKVKQEKDLAKLPLWEVIKRDKGSILRTMGICAGVMAPSQMIYVYMGDLLKIRFHLLPDQVLAHNMKIMVLTIITLPLMGYFADRVGYKKIMSLSLLGFISTSYPSFWIIEKITNPYEVLMVQSLLALLMCGVAAPCCVLVSNLFPARERYSGYALGWTVGSILFAGLTPLLALLFVRWTGNPKAPAYILMFCAAAGLLSMIEFGKTKASLHFASQKI